MSDETKYAAFADIPRDQKFSFCITPLPGRLLNLETVGKSWAALAEFHAELGKDIDADLKWKTCIGGVGLEEDGTLRVDVTVLPVEKEGKTK